MELEASYNPLIDVLPYFLVIHTCKFGNFIYIVHICTSAQKGMYIWNNVMLFSG